MSKRTCLCGLEGGRAHRLTRSGQWGQWHEGDRYNIRLGSSLFYDEGGYHTRNEVEILDKKTSKVHFRVGDGHQIGNFHPIWVNFEGKKITVEQLLRTLIE